MSGESSPRRDRQILAWFKEGGLISITLAGVLLYFFLSVPAAIFYARFGVSAGEVGISYASLLSGSTVEIFIIVVILACALVATAYCLSALLLIFWVYFIYIPYMFLHAGFLLFRSPDRLDDQQFERVLSSNRRIRGKSEWLLRTLLTDPSNEPTAVDRSIRQQRDLRKRRRELQAQLRELRRQSAPTTILSAQLDLIASQINTFNRRRRRALLQAPFLPTKTTIRRWGRVLIIGLVSVTVVVLLPILAVVQAGQVLDGKTYFGNNTGAFDYHADLVMITSSSNNLAPSIRTLQGEKLFLLGENAQYAVLYSPSLHSTIRVPINSVVISSI